MRMRKPLLGGFAILLTVCTAVALKAQDVLQADKDRALVYLESTKKVSLRRPRGCRTRSGTLKRRRIVGRSPR
jgi:hypothetical protein